MVFKYKDEGKEVKRYLTYDDVNIVPKYSELESREYIKLNTRFTKNTEIKIPIVSSPMDTVTEYEMAYGMWNHGGIGFIHRFMEIDKQSQMILNLKEEIESHWKGMKDLDISNKQWFENPPLGAAIGVTGDWLERAKELVFSGCNVLLIDVAHGHHKLVGDAIEKILLEDPNAVLITPAVQSSTGIVNAFKKFPDRCYDVSLAEQHAITLGAGFALQGIKPIVCYESTFMQLVFDQIHHDVCINNLPVLIIAGRSGHTGLDHVTHHGLHDLTYLRCIPNLRIIYPATHNELTSVIIQEFRNLKQPTVILYPKADILDDPNELFITDNDDLKKSQNSTGLILSVGTQNKNGLEVKHALEKQSIIFDHIAVTNIVPFSGKLADFMTKYDYIITMEEGIITGGFGELISPNLQFTHSLIPDLTIEGIRIIHKINTH